MQNNMKRDPIHNNNNNTKSSNVHRALIFQGGGSLGPYEAGVYKSQPISLNQRTLKFDYLVIALGSENNFFGITDIEENAFTMTTIDDAIILRNHIINILEQASNLEEEHNKELLKSLLTFVVVGGGFNGVETVGELNHFVRDTIKEYYKNIYMSDVRVILINATDKILEQVDEELGKFALQKLKESGVDME